MNIHNNNDDDENSKIGPGRALFFKELEALKKCRAEQEPGRFTAKRGEFAGLETRNWAMTPASRRQ